jgi:hypothetical protein
MARSYHWELSGPWDLEGYRSDFHNFSFGFDGVDYEADADEMVGVIVLHNTKYKYFFIKHFNLIFFYPLWIKVFSILNKFFKYWLVCIIY